MGAGQGDIAVSDGYYEPGWPFSSEEWDFALDVSVFTEKKLRKGNWFVLSVWLHKESDREKARERAGQLGRDKLVGEATGLLGKLGG